MRLAIVIGIAFLILQAAPFFISAYHTPPGREYLGTIHHPQDFFYYLSQFTQGKDSWFLSYDLFTSEFTKTVPIGWMNVVIGRIFSFLGIEPVIAYQITTTLSTGLLFIISYLFIRHVLGTSQRNALLPAFIFFLLGNAYPTIIHNEQGSTVWFYSYWFNLAEPYTRFGNVPHQLLGNAAIIVAFLSSLHLSRKTHTRKRLILYSMLLLCIGAVLGSVQPIQWIIVGGVIATTNIFSLWLHHGRIMLHPQKYLIAVYPSFLLFLGGLPFALSLRELLANLPYSQLAAWESAQQILAPPYYVFLAAGPVITASLLGILPLLAYKTPARILIALYFVSTSVLFLSPIPKLVGIQNVRFLSVVTFLTASILAADGLWFVTKRFPKIKTLRVGLLLIFFALSLPVFWLQTSPRFGAINTQNAFIFLETAVIDGYKEARRRSTPSDTFIAYWPMDVSFPGMTGRRGFMGHPLLTINNEEKNGLAYKLIEGRMTEAEAISLFREHNITFILAYNNTFKPVYPFVQEVYRNSQVTLYKISLSP